VMKSGPRQEAISIHDAGPLNRARGRHILI
jgi:hypothetical protein